MITGFYSSNGRWPNPNAQDKRGALSISHQGDACVCLLLHASCPRQDKTLKFRVRARGEDRSGGHGGSHWERVTVLMSDKPALRPLPPPSVAAARGDIDALTALLAEGLDINATTRTQPRTCLMEACKGNSDRAVDYLIAKRCCRAACGPAALPVPAAPLRCFAACACAGRARWRRARMHPFSHPSQPS